MAEYRCANCDILFDWQPTIAGRRSFCCAGCADGGPCSCDYDNLPRSRRRVSLDEQRKPGPVTRRATLKRELSGPQTE